MISDTVLWSVDTGKGRSIQVKLGINKETDLSELDLRWDDGTPVEFPIQLTEPDIQNLLDVVLEHAQKHGIDICLPQELTNRS